MADVQELAAAAALHGGHGCLAAVCCCLLELQLGPEASCVVADTIFMCTDTLHGQIAAHTPHHVL
jgi:hypothetical protein